MYVTQALPLVLYMPLWSWAELEACLEIFGIDKDRAVKLYTACGGVIRAVLTEPAMRRNADPDLADIKRAVKLVCLSHVGGTWRVLA